MLKKQATEFNKDTDYHYYPRENTATPPLCMDKKYFSDPFKWRLRSPHVHPKEQVMMVWGGVECPTPTPWGGGETRIPNTNL